MGTSPVVTAHSTMGHLSSAGLGVVLGGLSTQQATGQRNVAQSPVAGATRPHPSPFTNQPKQEGPQTSHASSRSIPEPPKPCSPGRMRQPEADDRREKTCVPSVSVLAYSVFHVGTFNWIRLTFRQFPAAQQFLRGHLAPGRTGLTATTTQPTRPKARAENNWSRPHLMLSGDLDFHHFAPGRLSTNGRGRLCLPGERPDAQVRGAFGRTRTPGENGLRYCEL